MQFRETGTKVQCLAAQYDPESKRTRQIMVLSLEQYRSNKHPAPEDLRVGSYDERVKWAAEIVAYLTEKEKSSELQAVENLPNRVRYIVDEIVRVHGSQSLKMTDSALAAIRDQIGRLGPIIGVQTSPVRAKSRPGASPRGAPGFDVAFVERARALRAEGLSVIKTADQMRAEGMQVSKSWVQKVTSATS